MRAAVLEAQGEPLRVRDDVEIEKPRPGWVRVRVAHCGLCHSDLALADGTFPAPLPVVLGFADLAAGRGIRTVLRVAGESARA